LRRTAAPPINYKLQGYKNSAQTFSGKKQKKVFLMRMEAGLDVLIKIALKDAGM